MIKRCERSDVPFVPSQIAQPDGGSIVTLLSAPRLNAEGGGSQAITVPVVDSGAFAFHVAMTMTSALANSSGSMPAKDFGRCDAYHRMSIVFARPNLADSNGSLSAPAAHRRLARTRMSTFEALITEQAEPLCPFVMPAFPRDV